MTGANQLRDAISKYTKNPYEYIFHETIYDVAAADIAILFDHYQDICDIYSSDKISRTVIGDLARSKQYTIFSWCLFLVQKKRR